MFLAVFVDVNMNLNVNMCMYLYIYINMKMDTDKDKDKGKDTETGMDTDMDKDRDRKVDMEEVDVKFFYIKIKNHTVVVRNLNASSPVIVSINSHGRKKILPVFNQLQPWDQFLCEGHNNLLHVRKFHCPQMNPFCSEEILVNHIIKF
jgi:hypothetical protein